MPPPESPTYPPETPTYDVFTAVPDPEPPGPSASEFVAPSPKPLPMKAPPTAEQLRVIAARRQMVPKSPPSVVAKPVPGKPVPVGAKPVAKPVAKSVAGKPVPVGAKPVAARPVFAKPPLTPHPPAEPPPHIQTREGENYFQVAPKGDPHAVAKGQRWREGSQRYGNRGGKNNPNSRWHSGSFIGAGGVINKTRLFGFRGGSGTPNNH